MLMLAAEAQSGALGLLDAGVIALLGYGVVFLGLILLMIVVIVIGKTFTAKEAKHVNAAPAAESTPAATPAPSAPGAAGQVKLHNVDPKTAAMLMAITADKMGKPINELRFISIKEVQ